MNHAERPIPKHFDSPAECPNRYRDRCGRDGP
jgi:hypothetical protein